MPAPLTKLPDALGAYRRTALMARLLMVALPFAGLGFAVISRSGWVLLAFVLPILPLVLVWEVARRRAIATAGAAIQTNGMTCLGCGFNLASLPHRAQCPECGLWNDAERTAVMWAMAFAVVRGDPSKLPSTAQYEIVRLHVDVARRSRYQRAWVFGCGALISSGVLVAATLVFANTSHDWALSAPSFLLALPLFLAVLAGPSIISAGSVGSPSVVAKVWYAVVCVLSAPVAVTSAFGLALLLLGLLNRLL